MLALLCASCSAAAVNQLGAPASPLISKPSPPSASREEANVRVTAVPGKGMGVFTVAPIAARAFVCEYRGQLSTKEECNARYENWSADDGDGYGDYMFSLGNGMTVDAQESSHFSRFFNHAEHGNTQPALAH